MIQAFVWKATKEELDTLERLIKAVFEGKSGWVIWDLSKDNITEVDGAGSLFCFGQRAFNMISTLTEQKIHNLPSVSKLTNKDENVQTRRETYDKLIKVSEQSIDIEEVTLSDKDLEKLMTNQLIALQKQLKKQKSKFWKGTTTTGKTVAITMDTNVEVDDCDIVMTFEEVFAAKYAMEVLHIDSLTVITGDNK